MKALDYITAGAFAKIHGVSHRRINTLCRQGRILYAIRLGGGRNWYVKKTSTVQPPLRVQRSLA